jgi:hypothetical protein
VNYHLPVLVVPLLGLVLPVQQGFADTPLGAVG